MINKDYENYGKPFHYLLSPSNWLDLDSLIYIAIVAILVFAVARIVAKCKGKKGTNIIDFLAKYMFICSVPIFILFFIQLVLSGQWRLDNIIISILPILYGGIIQLVFMIINKVRK